MKKKLFNLMGMVLILMLTLGINPSFLFAQSKVVLVGGNKPYKNLVDFVTRDQALNLGTGKTFYVDSGLAADGLGTSWESAKITVDAAINLCEASRGDVIMVAPGHAESFTAADGFDMDIAGVTIYMLGEGSNAPVFTFADTDATIAIGAANCKIVGGRYLAGISGVVVGISVEAGGDGFTMINPFFPEPLTSSFEFTDAISLASGANEVKIEYPVAFSADATGATHWLTIGAGAVNDLQIIEPYIYGEYSVAPIWSDQANLEVLIKGGEVTNLTTGQFAVEFAGASTGAIEDVLLRTDTQSIAVDPGSMTLKNVMWDDEDTADTIAIPVILGTAGVDSIGPVTSTTTDSLHGKIGSDAEMADLSLYDMLGANTATTTDSINGKIGTDTEMGDASLYDMLGANTAATTDSINGKLGTDAEFADNSIYDLLGAGSKTLSISAALGTSVDATTTDSLHGKIGTDTEMADSSLYDMLTTIDDFVDTEVAAIAADTAYIADGTLPVAPTANSLAAFVASGGTALGTELADSKSLVDAIGTNGTTVADTATGVAGIIGVDDADNAMATTSVVANKDGSVFERLEGLAQSSLYSAKSPNYLAVTADFLTASTWETVASHEIATVTGMVEMIIIPQCTETLTDAGDAADIQLGIAGDTDAIIAVTHAAIDAGDKIETNEFWLDATPADVLVSKTAMNAVDVVVGGGLDVGYEISGAAMTDGTIIFHIFWWPLDATGAVVAGGGGTL